MRGIFRGLAGLLTLLAVLGGGAGYWLFLRGDEMLRVELLKHLTTTCPDARLAIGSAHFDWEGRVRISNLTIQLPGTTEPALRIPEVVVTLDRELLSEHQSVIVKAVRLIGPELIVERRADGSFDWQSFTIVSESEKPLPDVQIEHGVVTLRLVSPQTGTPVTMVARDLEVRLTPLDMRAIKLERCEARIEPAGPVSVSGTWRMDGPTFDFRLKLAKLPVDDSLFPWLAEFSPHISGKLQEATALMQQELARQAASDQSGPSTQVPWQLQTQSPQAAASAIGPFGVQLVCDVEADVSRKDPDLPPTFAALATLRSGQIANPVLPFPLFDLGGQIFVDPGRLIVKHLRAQNGTAQVDLSAEILPGEKVHVSADVAGLPLDAAMKRRLPDSLHKMADTIGLTGLFRGHAEANRVGDEEWKFAAALEVQDGAVTAEKFPYTVREIVGKLDLKDDILNMTAEGKAGGVPVKAVGLVKRPGPEADVVVRITAADVPIDRALLEAFPPEIRRAIEVLQLQGLANANVRLVRAPGLGQKFEPQVVAFLHDCTLRYQYAPYRINQLNGEMTWMGGDRIEFARLSGVHDGAALSGEALYLREPAPGRLQLKVHGENATFDRDVEFALPQVLKEVWAELSPRGLFDIDFNVDWVPDRPPEIRVPLLKVSQGEMLLRQFPFPLRNIQAKFKYDAPILEIQSFTAENDETRLSLNGRGDIPGSGPWELNFESLEADDVTFSPAFRRALPQSLKVAVDGLNPTGTYSFYGPVTLVGPDRTGESVSASWKDAKVVFTGCGLNAGLRVEGIHGQTVISGRTTPLSTEVSGRLELDSVSVMKHQVTEIRGPWEYNNGVFTAGSRAEVERKADTATTTVSAGERLTGKAIGGSLTLNAVADLRGKPVYSVESTLQRGRLEEYARRYLAGRNNLAGEMNGWMRIDGEGVEAEGVRGAGRLQITHASLYELPIFVQIMRIPTFQPIDKTAFRHADIYFNIANSRFNFAPISLEGPISMYGQGTVGFDGVMALKFYSRMPRNRLGIPVVREIVEAVSTGWVGVDVRGSVGSPIAETIPAPLLNEAVKDFFGRFQPGNPGPPATFRPRTSDAADSPKPRS